MSITRASTQPFYSSSTFPSSPVTNQFCFRTDRDILYFYDGSQWLSTTLYHADMAGVFSTTTTSGTTWGRASFFDSGTEIYLVDFISNIYVATTNTGSAYWTATLRKYQGDFTTNTSLATPNTSAGSPNTTTRATTSLNAVLTIATYPIVQVELTKTGSPGGTNGAYGVTYRLVG